MSHIRLRFRTRALAVVVASTMLLALVPSATLAQEGQKVAQVVVTGNHNINKDVVSNVIKLAPGADYTKEAVDKDRTAINATGYFSAVSVRTEDTPEGVRVIYDVVENPVVKSIEIVGSGPVPEQSILALMRTQPNQVLNTSTLNIDIDAIQRHYRDEGYVAYVTEDIGIDRETGVLTIPVLVHTVESIDIVGNKKTKDYVFLREMKTTPGMTFNMKTLRDDISRIYNLDILEDIQTPKIEPGTEIGKLNIAIPVTEKKTGSVSIGLGYSSQSRLVGRAELSETNLRGRGQGLTLLFETGASDSRLGGRSSYEIGYHEPWIDSKHTSLSVNVFNKLLYRFSSSFIGGSGEVAGETYNERRKGASIGVSRPLTDYTRGFITLRAESVETTDIGTTVPGNGLVAQNGDIRSATGRLVNDTRDFITDPAVGWYRSMSLELGDADVSQQFSTGPVPLKGGFQKLQFDVRRYWSKEGRKSAPNDKRTTIAVRLLGGISNGEIPFFEQFFVGGSETLRGYREDRFWGDKMLVASVEYRRPIAQSLKGVLFLDYGDAWDANENYTLTDFPQHQGFHPNLGVGVGLRVATPVGNIRLDYGVGSEGARTHFSIGHAF